MDVFDLVAKLTLGTSEYEQNLGGAKETATKGGGAISSALGTAVKVGGAAVAAGATAVAAVTKSAVESYADYEQLVGGVETLFGESAGKVIDDANQAFKTAGMSVNEYMETSIQSAAAMINSLGGDQEKAAEMMNMSITDMSDNVNKMGTTMESVQNAYRGFSRGNFTMLDNLALGFAGTKEGMQQLLDKASEFAAKNGEVRDFSIESYADIVDAIHIVQTEMGITGTTAKEASDTIQGSISATKSAYRNWITGLADENADIEQLTNQLFDAIEVTANNLIPVVERVLTSLGNTLKTKLPELVSRAISYVVAHIPDLIKLGVQLVKAVMEGLLQGFKTLLTSLTGWLKDFLVAPFKNLVSQAKQWGLDLISNFVGGIKEKLNNLKSTLSGVANTVKRFLGFSEPEEGPLSNFHTFAPDMMKLFAKGIKDNEHLVTDQISKSFDFGSPVAGFSGGTTNTYNITVNGIEELEDMLRWFESRQVRARMA